MKSLSITTQGVKGGNTKTQGIGYVLACIDNHEQRISIDNFSGQGSTYKQREEPLIEIIENGKILSSGTFNELKDKLS